jgi:predicted membrane-bound dolichyl-phosphate-mannose-protein mannosyltransferase
MNGAPGLDGHAVREDAPAREAVAETLAGTPLDAPTRDVVAETAARTSLDVVPGDVAQAGTARGRRPKLRQDAIGAYFRGPRLLFGVLLIFSLITRTFRLDIPKDGLIFDEAYYVNAARVILELPVKKGDSYWDRKPGMDPNQEHPPLGKLLMARSMAIFGDNGIGWRLPSVIAGMGVLVALWLALRATGASEWLALLAVFLVSQDNLSFVHGRIGVLDIMALAPALLAAWLALKRRWLLAGVLMAVALLVKLTAMYAIGAIGLLWLLMELPGFWAARRVPLRRLAGPVVFVVTSVALFAGGLGLLDWRWSEHKNPLQHIRHMVTYGANLSQPVGTVGICPDADSRPWQWLVNDCQIQYFRIDVSTTVGEELKSRYTTIDFRGAMNELLAGALPVAMLFTIWLAWQKRDTTALWAVAWAAANWLPYLLLAVISRRIMYIYYFLPTVPAVATAIAVLLLHSRLPRFVLWGFLLLYSIGFAWHFPFRALPGS